MDPTEPAAAGPFRGAGPDTGTPWLGTADAQPPPSDIEPTTGAPFAMLPQRAPRAVPAWDRPVPSAPGGTVDDADAAADDDDFWLPIEEVHWDGTPVQPTPRTWFGRPRKTPAEKARARQPRPPAPPRHPAFGLFGATLLALAASFFAWVSAEPLWLAAGHGERGTATVVACVGRGITVQCRGAFSTADGPRFAGRHVRLVGVPGGQRHPGAELTARMVGPDARTAYVGQGMGELHLRWVLGFGLVALCAVATGWASGATRLPDRRSRRRAMLVGIAGPLLLSTGFVAAAY